MKAKNSATWGLTIIELLLVSVILAVLVTLALNLGRHVHRTSRIGVSIMQLHQLVAANAAYAADHDGEFCPAMSPDNRTRWHGGRNSLGEKFDPRLGYLSPYFGGSERLLTCPLLDTFVKESFEAGAGGYGYNAEYIGGRPDDRYRGACLGQVENLGCTVMFATTALATSNGVQEYPFTEPRFWVDRRGRPRGELQPSTHFRANGRALIAWGGGNVTLEEISLEDGPNYYGGNNKKERIGWFGPREDNGYWNPNSPATNGRRAPSRVEK